MFHPIGRFAATHPWVICAVWVIVGVLLAVVAPNWDGRTQDDDIRFLPDRCPSVRGYQLMQEAFPEDVFASRLVFAVERQDTPLTDADFGVVKQLMQDLEQLRKDQPELGIGKPCCCRDGIVGGRLLSNDKHCTLIQVPLASPFLALQTQAAVDRAKEVLQKRIAETGPNAPQLYATGSAGIGRDLVTAAGDSLDGTTLATIALVIIVLLLVYRAPLLALIPLVTIAMSVWVAMELLALMTLLPGVHLVNISKVFAIVILYGAGTDYCLFLISRYREELTAGHPVPTALGLSVGAVGAALAASAGTVMCGLGLMGTAEFAKVRYAGPAIALSLGVALVASLTLTPALLRLAGKNVFWPGKPPQVRKLLLTRRERETGLWSWISHFVADHPVLTMAVAVLALLPLAILGCNVKPNYRPTSELSPTSDSVLGLAAIQRHFPVGETGPLTVLLVSSTDWTSKTGQVELDHLSRGFASLPGVAEVRSLSQPLGKPMSILGTAGSLFQQGRKDALAHYVSKLPGDGTARHVTRIDLILDGDPFDAASTKTMSLVQSWLRDELPSLTVLSDLRTEIFGVTANSHDLAQVTESDRVRVNLLILAGIFIILLVLVRRPGFALYLLVTVLFSYFATLGATRLAGVLWTGHTLEQVDWRVPFFLFTILVAVGEDYNILLVTRALQEREKYGAREGMRRALARTGSTITSCGLIVAGTFATLMLAKLNTLKQIGFALAFGVLLDTFIVRPLLVPAFAMLFWKDEIKEPPHKEDIILAQLAQYRKAS
ncbi:MAG TPA: MMPL family transporter [Gemmataceae bacterium]|nr:MMPL family transporter [Gemmataceae bacterium]